jgi:hypothetical protein
MKYFFALCTAVVCLPAFAGNLFNCHFSATEGASAPAEVDFQITSDTGKKLLYLSNGELIFALPIIGDASSQLELYVGGTCDGCTAYRFFQSDEYESGQRNQFSANGNFVGNEFAKSVFTYTINCAVAPAVKNFTLINDSMSQDRH